MEQLLASLFAVEIAFHTEMSNHIHLVVRTRPDVAATWSDEDVVRRWLIMPSSSVTATTPWWSRLQPKWLGN